ncbi:putative transmembrane permease MsmF [Treponema socranskii subsp. socranskii VPI DR56BR1116 = ATCC 35536]|uniref:Transmembrane permease MsmF n=2 Tax=Treponema socranskii subsp. socranskii VPI DR56BR1116 = ATCC 35536 TaxID=1125725 RepID=A0ABP2YN36_TRESO|nr:putative transmembrane permease MsmF [Treponema socranskii subsp. socranskii VPI DR56BR1116 = ATCC 35536]
MEEGGMKSYSKKLSGLQKSQARTARIYCIPAFLCIFIFYFFPFVLAVFYSFTNKMLVPRMGKPTDFVGLQNYLRLFTNETAAIAFRNTALYALMVVPAVLLLGTILAVFVNKQLTGVKVFRAVYFSPQVVTMTVVAVVWSYIFSPGQAGLLNSFLGVFGIPPQTWLQNGNQALPCLAFMYIWQTLGLEMVIILGGLQYIPHELYEASYLDGCSVAQRFFYITIPMLRNTLVYVLISVTIGSLKLFTQVYVLTNGGPKNATVSVIYLLYKAGFINNQVGYSSAIAVVFFLIVFAVSLMQNHLTKEK